MAELAQVSWVEVSGYVASMLVFWTFYMKTMIPLRIVGILGNVAFMAYGLGGRLYPVLILHAILLPLNCVRLFQMQTLVRKVREAAKGDHSMEWLIPYMQSRTVKKGVLFRKGDAAKEMYLVLSGSVRLMEVGVTVHPGTVIGEIGIFAPSGQRMDTAICESDVELASISNDKVWQLYHQNPKFGFYLIKLVIHRLLQNSSKQQSAAATPVEVGFPSLTEWKAASDTKATCAGPLACRADRNRRMGLRARRMVGNRVVRPRRDSSA